MTLVRDDDEFVPVYHCNDCCEEFECLGDDTCPFCGSDDIEEADLFVDDD